MNLGSSVVTNVPLWGGTQRLGEAIHVWGRGMWEICMLARQFCCDAKATLKKKVLKKGKTLAWKLSCNFSI